MTKSDPFKGDGQLQAIMATLEEARADARLAALRHIFCEEHALAILASWHLPTQCFMPDCDCVIRRESPTS